MIFLKKSILFTLLFFCTIGLFAQSKSNLKKAVKNSEGYFYNEEIACVMYLSLNDYGDLIVMQPYYPYFNLNRLVKRGGRLISIDNNPVKQLQKIFSPEKGKILYFKDMKDIYYPIPESCSSESRILDFMKGIAEKKFEKCLGEFVLPESKRKYKLEKKGREFILTIVYPKENYSVLTEVLILEDFETLKGKTTKIKFLGTKEADYSYEIYDLHYTSYDYYFEVYDARVNQFEKSKPHPKDCGCEDDNFPGFRASFNCKNRP